MSTNRFHQSAHVALRAAFAAVLLLLALPTGCSSGDSGCVGIVAEDGSCVKQCSDDQCQGEGYRCVQNECQPPCETQGDCALGTNCVTYQFGADDQGLFCAVLDYAKGGRTGQNEPCAADTECDQMRGYQCVDGECLIPGCRTHADCAGIGLCAHGGTDANGKPITFCQRGETYPEGQFGTMCPKGDPDDNPECDRDNGFACVGAGDGDVDGYCTLRDCASDDECATGYFCSEVRSGGVPCQDACGFTGDPDDPACVPAADIGEGKKYRCGPLSLVRNLCLKREFCNECETDLDCGGLANQVCAKDTEGNKICTVICDPALNSCPWGNAGTCGVWDEGLGIATCAHRFGSCSGSGALCEPCVDESDCGANGLCLSSGFTGERYCVDLDVTCSCAGLVVGDDETCSGGGCPDTPGGLQGTCLGGAAYADSPLYNKCIAANVNPNPLTQSPQRGCWPQN